jgi:Holliday junction resolvasome RuvABC endonuclease subunit
VIAGVDIATRRVDLCIINQAGEPTWQRLEVPDHLDSLQAARAIGALASYFDWTGAGIQTVWIERSMGKFVRSAADLSRVVGVVLAGIPAAIPVSEIPPQEWKTHCGLKGNAGKSDVIRWARDHARASFAGTEARPELDLLDSHQADAYAIAMACWRASEREVARLVVR